MNLIVDRGNTRTKIALFFGDEMKFHYVFSNDDDSLIVEQIKEHDEYINGVIYSNVFASSEVIDSYLCGRFPGCLFFNSSTPLPIMNNYDTPHTLGMDRLAAVVGAFVRNPHQNSLVIDAGTAITYDYISEAGVYEGGGISLGLQMRFKALHAFTNKLPCVVNTEKRVILGKNTIESINFGVTEGMIFEIEGFIAAFKERYPLISIFFTGGDVHYFENKLKYNIIVAPFLIEEGLNRILIHYEGKV